MIRWPRSNRPTVQRIQDWGEEYRAGYWYRLWSSSSSNIFDEFVHRLAHAAAVSDPLAQAGFGRRRLFLTQDLRHEAPERTSPSTAWESSPGLAHPTAWKKYEEVRACRERLRSRRRGGGGGIGHFDNGELKLNQRVWNLVNKGQIFRDVLFHPVLRELLPELLGEDYNLSSLTANIAAPGGEPMPLHSDQGYTPRSLPIRVVVNTAWLLEGPLGGERGGRGWCRGATCGRSCPRTSRTWRASSPPGRPGRC